MITWFHHYHIRNLLPVCGMYQYWQFELEQSQDSRSNLYQRPNVKSVPEKWIKFGIFSLSYTKKVKNLIHLGWVRLIVSLSSTSVLTLTVWAGFFNVTVQQWLICKKRPLFYTTWHGKCFLKIITNLKFELSLLGFIMCMYKLLQL